jgi:transcriptional regulator with XRE-family HTH domain
MDIGNRLRSVREEKNLSQGGIEQRTGLLRCYISRVENGHTVPAIETLEKWRERWSCHSISSCMTVRSHLLYH